jgi:hypothetical protein
MTEPLLRPVRTSSPAPNAQPAEDLLAADPLPDFEASNGTGIEPDRESPPSTPRWVQWFGIIAIVLVLLFAGLHLTGNAPTHMPPSSGAQHGMPGMQTP